MYNSHSNIRLKVLYYFNGKIANCKNGTRRYLHKKKTNHILMIGIKFNMEEIEVFSYNNICMIVLNNYKFDLEGDEMLSQGLGCVEVIKF